MKQLTLAVVLGLAAAAGVAQARDNIEIVGSSTVFPFSTAVAEQFAKKNGGAAPKVESTGTGGGMKLFCSGAGVETPDITNASRRMKKGEMETCIKNGVTDITEIKIGYDGLAIAQSKTGEPIQLSARELYLAVAKEIPMEDGTFVPNTYNTWKDLNPNLPANEIEVIGPPPTSGTRDSFVELGIEKGCMLFKGIPELKKKDEKMFKEKCHTLREDGRFVEAGENDNLIVQKLQANPKSLGVFGYSFLEQNADSLKAVPIAGVEPTPETVMNGKYPMARSMFIYAKNNHVGQVAGLKEFLVEFASDAAMGADGYLADKGLIPLPANELKASQDAAATLKTVSVNSLK
ncbi:phosphate ABC transporter substrate-binding protein [Thiothrix subterranea]|uniref:substrate-binding domain-containing protein n=1 Tax=Thiothrix subterranea TaxID=2735563 RepID=UPI00192AF101|nr:substrate-binding domain-containing protein [Thiothrix subterranea]QQZ30476.1 phosphate ABC transporter substrate-binding protein [Thiothrix subterranea]